MTSQDGVSVTWRSAPCSDGNCVEIASADSKVLVRNSRDPHGPVLVFTPDEWDAFVAGVRSGALDLR
jgi:monoamine oxidase